MKVVRHIPARLTPAAGFWIVLLLAVPMLSGCSWLVWRRGDKPPMSDAGHVPQTLWPVGRIGSSLTADDVEQLLAVFVDVPGTDGTMLRKEVDGWRMLLAGGEPAPDSDGYRWRHDLLAELLSRPARRRPDLRRVLTSENRLVAATATIGLARQQAGDYNERLAEIVRTPTLPMSLRSAAAETLAMVRRPSPEPLLMELLEQYGRHRRDARGTYVPELHAELLRGLARHVDLDRDGPHLDWFRRGLSSPQPEVCVDTLRILERRSSIAFSREVVDLISSTNPRVRIAAIRVASAQKNLAAMDEVLAAVRDVDLSVKLAAIECLGQFSTQQSLKTLTDLSQGQPERIREAAVAALAVAGGVAAIQTMASDDSWRVRRAVADSLAQGADSLSVAVAGRLLVDPSIEVRLRVVDAIAKWPPKESGGLLLRALAASDQRTRERAKTALADFWPPAAEFRENADKNRRAPFLAELKRRWQADFPDSDDAPPANDPADPSQVDGAARHKAIAPEVVERVGRLVEQYDASAAAPSRRVVRAKLLAVGSDLLPALEQLCREHDRTLSDSFYADVLASADRTFDALEQLRTGERAQRRSAAKSLAGIAKDGGLAPLAVRRLAEVTVMESDVLTWMHVFETIADTSSEPAERIALAALTHPTGEVRRRACAYLAAHGAPRHAGMLLATLDDSDVSVVREATRALGRVGSIRNAAPLRAMLAANDPMLQVEAARALARLGYPSGLEALQRLTYATDEKLLRKVAEAMGSLGDPACTAALVRLLDGRDSVRRAALAALPQAVGRDVAADASEDLVTAAQKAEYWKRWHEGRPGSPHR